MKKKSFDFPDHHYRDAITRLKTMLSDSYSPVKYASTSSIFKSVTDDETDTTENTIIERPAFKEVSKYFPFKPYSTYSNVSSLYGHNKIGVTSQNMPLSCECVDAWKEYFLTFFYSNKLFIRRIAADRNCSTTKRALELHRETGELYRAVGEGVKLLSCM